MGLSVWLVSACDYDFAAIRDVNEFQDYFVLFLAATVVATFLVFSC